MRRIFLTGCYALLAFLLAGFPDLQIMKLRNNKPVARAVNSSVLQTIQEPVGGRSDQNNRKLTSSLLHNHDEPKDTTALLPLTKPSRNEIEELKKKLRIASQTNEQLQVELHSSHAKVRKLTKDKSHLIQKIRLVWSKLPQVQDQAHDDDDDAVTTKTTKTNNTYQAQILLLEQKLSVLQLDHDQLVEQHYSLRRKKLTTNTATTMTTMTTLRQNQVSQLQTKVSNLQGIHKVHLHLLSLYRELAHHSGYHQWGKSIRQAEHELVVALHKNKNYSNDASTCGGGL